MQNRINIFVIMPFGASFDDTHSMIKQAASEINEEYGYEFVNCIRLDEAKKPGKITDDMIKKIQESHICISDVTENNPNVMYETGFAAALNKPVIYLTQNIEILPFDIKADRAIIYKSDNLPKLKDEIKKFITNTLPDIEIKSSVKISRFDDDFSIYITGSMEVERKKFLTRLEIIIEPYLNKKTRWYVGSFGMADELAAEYLCKLNERVVIVGYHAFDISAIMRDIIKKNDLKFIIPQYEQIIYNPNSLSERDTYMANKTNLAVLLWNGKSKRTQKLIDWYKESKKDFLLGFC